MLIKILGIPLVSLGVLVLVVHYALHARMGGVGANVLLCVGVLLEVAGIVGYCWRVRH